MPLGGNAVNYLRVTPIGRHQWFAEWTPLTVPASRAYMVAVDGKHYETVIDRASTIIRGDFSGIPSVEVVQLPSEYGDPGYFISGYLSTIISNKVKLTWSPPATVTDVVKYHIYWDDGGGTVGYTDDDRIGIVFEDGSDDYEFWTDAQSSDTYKFVIRTVDAAGNESTNTTATSVTLTTYPAPVTGVALSYAAGTQKVTLTWTDSADIGAGTVRVYDNDGSTTDFFPDYSTAQDTVAAAAETWTSPALADGIWVYGLRTDDGTNEEPNTSILLSVRIESGVAVSGPPTKPLLTAVNADGGTVTLRASVDPQLGAGKPTKVKFFTNDGAGGAVDYGTALNSDDFVALGTTGTRAVGDLTTAVYGETERIFGLRAYTAAGVASVNADEVTITPDASVPPDPLTIAGVAGRD